MSISRRNFLKLSSLTALGASLGNWAQIALAQPEPSGNPALHVLNRITWGVRADDVALIEQLGIEGYIDWQLWPENIPDPVVDAFMSEYAFLNATPGDLDRVIAEDYERVYIDAIWARIYRAVYSERQLFEQMVEFWTDHFNVPIGDLLGEKIIDDREVVRQHALGKFRDLLFASAQSSAMLYYLNQAESEKEHPNENYAREVMELHTLGVDGGYTEQDVVEVARALTGWTVKDGWPGEFYFDINRHDTEAKTVLGHHLPAGRGIEDGLQVLDMLATHPATAQFISRKLVRRFVSDNPPQSLIDSTTLMFTATDGDIRQVMRHILLSSEFLASEGQKFRRPIDLMAATLRVTRDVVELTNSDYVIWMLEAMGQMPYSWHPPNGYPDAAGAWMSTGGMLARWNLAMLLPLAVDGWFEGLDANLDALIPDAPTVSELVDTAAMTILQRTLDENAREYIVHFVASAGDPNEPASSDLRSDKLPALVGILLASPQFQWH